MKAIDARGLACPAPVLLAKAAIEKENPAVIKILVDNGAAKQNICRFLESQQFAVSAVPQGSEFEIIGTRQTGVGDSSCTAQEPTGDVKKILVLAATDRMGTGDDELGRRLMVNFIKTLKEMGRELWRLVLVNNGVKLTVAGSAVLEILQEYEQSGVQVLVCGTCLEYFQLLDKKQVGQTTNMLDIVTAMQVADKVIPLT